ncbi:MAG: endonuclease domain-containing protein [Nitrospirae bacterium]|nr:endonuclease domain-containing protein [Nitrospirota bacterium]
MGDKITTLGKALRKRPTDAEQLLWNHLRMKQMEGLKFRRQQPIDKYIVDFVCFENSIIIEVDGGQHAAERNKDIESTGKINLSTLPERIVSSLFKYMSPEL